MKSIVLVVALGMVMLATGRVSADEPKARAIINRVLESDPWGLSGAEISARVVLTDKSGTKKELAFSGRSMRYEASLSKSIVRFTAPADLAGAGFLQVQKAGGDDDRYLFLPELKRSRRIAGDLRSTAFMGTDFSYADLDRRDLRESDATLKGEEAIGKFTCDIVDLKPKATTGQYSRIELWVRRDNALPLRMKLYDRSGEHIKTYETLEVKRVSGQWFISKSRMTSHREKHSTELFLDQIGVPTTQLSENEFNVRALEKP